MQMSTVRQIYQIWPYWGRLSPTRLAVYDKRARRGLQKLELELTDERRASTPGT